MKFFAHFISESCDHKYVQFTADKMPDTDEDWFPIMDKHDMTDSMGEDNPPGMCGGWWSLRHCEEIV